MSKSAVITTVPLHPVRGETCMLYIGVQVFDPKTGKLGAAVEAKFDPAQAINQAPHVDGATVMKLIGANDANSNYYRSNLGEHVDGKTGITRVLDFLRGHEVKDIWYDSNVDNVLALKWLVQHYIHDVTLCYLLRSVKFYDYALPLNIIGGSNPNPEIWMRGAWAAGFIHKAVTGFKPEKLEPVKKAPAKVPDPEDDEL